MARAIIPRGRIKDLIGPRGSVINAIRNETSATIRIDDDRSLVIIEADSQERIQATMQKINESLNSQLSFQPVKQAQPRSPGDQVEVEHQSEDGFFREQTTVPRERIGVLIGSHGSTIKALQEETQTTITIDNETGVVTIEGLTEQHVAEARARVMETTTIFTALVQIKKDQIGLLIGRQGSTIKELKEGSGTGITIDQNTAIVTIEGNKIEKVESAISGIDARLTKYKATTSVPTTRQCLGAVFGTGGSTIKSIQRDTNISRKLFLSPAFKNSALFDFIC